MPQTSRNVSVRFDCKQKGSWEGGQRCVGIASPRSPLAAKLYTFLPGAWPVPERAHQGRNGCQPPASHSPGLGDIQGRGRALHPGRVGPPEPCPEDPLPGRDAGELQPPGLSGTLRSQARHIFSAGKRGRMGPRGWLGKLLS